MITCEKVMERGDEYVYPQTTAQECLELFRKMSVDSLPVIESELSNKLVGTINESQILFGTYYEDLNPKHIPVKELMNSNVVICGVGTTIDDALVTMLKNGVKRLPVVDRQNRLVGIFSVKALKEYPELKFSWKNVISSLDDKMFESNFEKTREAFENRMEMEVANLLSMIDIMQLKTRVAANEGNVNILRSAIFDELDILKQDLEKKLKTMIEAEEDNWYLMRDEFEATRHQLNEKLFYLKEPLEQLSARDYPGVSVKGPIKSTK